MIPSYYLKARLYEILLKKVRKLSSVRINFPDLSLSLSLSLSLFAFRGPGDPDDTEGAGGGRGGEGRGGQRDFVRRDRNMGGTIFHFSMSTKYQQWTRITALQLLSLFVATRRTHMAHRIVP
jgi:hypothetical protein